MTIPVPTTPVTVDTLDSIAEEFAKEHEKTYGYRSDHESLQLSSLKAVGRGLPLTPRVPDSINLRDERGSTGRERKAYYGPKAGWQTTPVIGRSELAGSTLAGPLIVEEYDSTTVVPPGYRASLDEWDEHNRRSRELIQTREEPECNVTPITQELVRNALATIADNMAVTVVRTARSQVVKQSLDFSTGICDAEARMVSQGLSIPVHLGAIMPCLEGVLKDYGDDVQPGDIFISNDPYEGGSHLPDIFLFKPVFAGNVLLGFLAVIAHHTDIGGRVAGGNACDSTEIYQEGLRIPPLKLFNAGEPNHTIFRLLKQNVRVPDKVLGDLWAQIAALYGGEREMLSLAQEHGVEELKGYMEELIEYTERRTRAEISALPQGEAEFTDYVDDDGIDPEPIRIHVKVSIKGDEVYADFTGTSPQAKGAINPNFAFTKSCVYAAVRCLLSPDLPNNAGYFRPIKVYAPEGCFANPQHPAPVAARALGGLSGDASRIRRAGQAGSRPHSRVLGKRRVGHNHRRLL